MTKTFQAPAILTGLSTLSDGGLAIRFHTNELSLDDKATALGFQGKFGWLCFRENEFSDADIPDTDAPDEDRSPSQRLRAALFVLYQQRGEKRDFESFYRENMERAISRVKNLLD